MQRGGFLFYSRQLTTQMRARTVRFSFISHPRSEPRVHCIRHTMKGARAKKKGEGLGYLAACGIWDGNGRGLEISWTGTQGLASEELGSGRQIILY